jgi:dTDP-glucose pyrophosphorylase
LNIIVPLAGDGARFRSAGYTCPKPFLDIEPGLIILDAAIKPFMSMGDVTFLVREEHSHLIPIRHKILVPGLTEGSACTVLLSKEIINNNQPLLIVNSDQIVKFDYYIFRRMIAHKNPDGIIFAFPSSDPKFSYAKVDLQGRVVETAEKRVISNDATCGIYYFHRGSDFVSCAEEMIAANDRFNNEYYTAPVYNYLIRRGGLVLLFDVEEMICLGTPEEYEQYCSNSTPR